MIFKSDYHYTIYIVGFYLFFSTYFVMDRFLSSTNEKYRRLSNEKQMYVVSNILKGILLCGITPIVGNILYETMYLDNWDNNLIKNMGIVYAIPDCVSLTLVKKMDMTTKIHHSIVCIFNIFSIRNDYNNDNIIRCMVIYACFSCFAFIVNILLGTRYLHDNRNIGIFMAKVAMYIYVTCCFINWAWHGKYVYLLANKCDNTVCQITIPTYCGMVMMLAWDDIKLNKWLYKEAYKNERTIRKD